MKTLRELDIPKEIKKKKKVKFYKAFLLNNGDEMRIHTDIDIFAFTPEAAVEFLVTSLDVSEALLLKGKMVHFATFEFDTNELASQKLINAGEVYCQDLNISITLDDKRYKIGVEDRLIDNIDVEVDPKTEIKVVTNLSLIDIAK